MVLMYPNTKEFILTKVASLYSANLIKTEFLRSFFFYLDFKEHRFPKQLKKQPPEVFYKKSFFKKFRSIHRKTPVLESLFNKVADLQLDCFS